MEILIGISFIWIGGGVLLCWVRRTPVESRVLGDLTGYRLLDDALITAVYPFVLLFVLAALLIKKLEDRA